MPDHLLNLPQALELDLQKVVDGDNARTGAALSLDQWILLHLKEVAIAEEIAATAEALRRQFEARAQRDLQTAGGQERQRLLARYAVDVLPPL